MYRQQTRAAQGYQPGQEGVWGVRPTATFPQMMVQDSRVIYVNPNHVEAVDLGNLGLDPTIPFATIQAALAQTRDNHGDVILVGANQGWQYYSLADRIAQPAVVETVTVTTNGVSIIGVGPSPLGVSWHPVATGDFCLTVYSMDVHIEGFAFTGVNSGLAVNNGIYSEWGGTFYGDNLVITRCFFDQDIDTAIQLAHVYNSEISYCRFQRCEVVGIYCDPNDTACYYGSVHDNLFMDIGIGGPPGIGAISLDEAQYTEIFNNRIYNSSAENAAPAIDEGINTGSGAYNIVSDNYLSCARPAGANGDYNDFCTGSGTDAWINNHCLNGDTTTTP